MKKEYWFYIDSYVHIVQKKTNILLYNPYNGAILEYRDRVEIGKLIRRIQSPRNLRVVLLKDEDLAKPEINGFINDVRAHFMGDLLDVSASRGKPVQMSPMPKIMKDIKNLRSDDARSIGEELLNYISSLTLFLNESCRQSCRVCDSAYRQFNCCTSGKKGDRSLDIRLVEGLLAELKNAPLTEINISGGDIFQYSSLGRLSGRLQERRDVTVTYTIHYRNIAANLPGLGMLASENARIHMPVDFPVEEDTFASSIRGCGEHELRVTPSFVIGSESDFQQAEMLQEKYNIADVMFNAFFDGGNLEFFRENIFIDREDIQSARPALREIYTRQFINSTTFGGLVFFPDNRVAASTISPALGILGKDSICDLLIRELEQGKTWRKIRGNVNPCKSCTFVHLCPPLSNYNFIMGKNDLCHIWKE